METNCPSLLTFSVHCIQEYKPKHTPRYFKHHTFCWKHLQATQSTYVYLPKNRRRQRNKIHNRTARSELTLKNPVQPHITFHSGVGFVQSHTFKQNCVAKDLELKILSVKRTVLYGPMQLFVIGFPGNKFKGEIVPAINEAKEKRIIRMIDYLFISKDKDGKIVSSKGTDLGRKEIKELDSVLGSLLGLGMAGIEGAKVGALAGEEFGEHDLGISEEDMRDIVGYIPKNTSVLVMIVEHLWAKKIKQTLVNANGLMIAQGMITPELMVMIGMGLRDEDNDDLRPSQTEQPNLGLKSVLQ
jgi:uncharacterized membrane protein